MSRGIPRGTFFVKGLACKVAALALAIPRRITARDVAMLFGELFVQIRAFAIPPSRFGNNDGLSYSDLRSPPNAPSRESGRDRMRIWMRATRTRRSHARLNERGFANEIACSERGPGREESFSPLSPAIFGYFRSLESNEIFSINSFRIAKRSSAALCAQYALSPRRAAYRRHPAVCGTYTHIFCKNPLTSPAICDIIALPHAGEVFFVRDKTTPSHAPREARYHGRGVRFAARALP